MLKGCQRRIIMVRETKSPYFDTAYFVLRSDLPSSAGEHDMMKEAYRMIDACHPDAPPTSYTAKKKTFGVGSIVIIALLCAIIPTAAAVGIMCLVI